VNVALQSCIIVALQGCMIVVLQDCVNGPCHVSGIFFPLRVNSLPLATIYEVNIPLRKWKNPLLQRNPAQMTWHIVALQGYVIVVSQGCVIVAL
jgi:hypothetical protein